MIAKCKYCLIAFEAKRSTAVFCSDVHRTLFGKLSDDAKNEKETNLKNIENGKEKAEAQFGYKLLDGHTTAINKVEFFIPTGGEKNEPNDEEILKKIAEALAEKIPPERDTWLGRRVWKHDKNIKITELESQLKPQGSL